MTITRYKKYIKIDSVKSDPIYIGFGQAFRITGTSFGLDKLFIDNTVIEDKDNGIVIVHLGKCDMWVVFKYEDVKNDYTLTIQIDPILIKHVIGANGKNIFDIKRKLNVKYIKAVPIAKTLEEFSDKVYRLANYVYNKPVASITNDFMKIHWGDECNISKAVNEILRETEYHDFEPRDM